MSHLPPRRTRHASSWPRTIAWAVGLSLVVLLVGVLIDGFDPSKDIEHLLRSLGAYTILFRYFHTRSSTGAKSFGYYLFWAVVAGGGAWVVAAFIKRLLHIQ